MAHPQRRDRKSSASDQVVDPWMSLKEAGSVSSVAAFGIPRVKYTSLPSLEVGFLKYTPMKTAAP